MILAVWGTMVAMDRSVPYGVFSTAVIISNTFAEVEMHLDSHTLARRLRRNVTVMDMWNDQTIQRFADE